MLRTLGLGLLSLALLIPSATAQTATLLPTETATWQVHVNVRTLLTSPLGDIVNDIIRREAPEGNIDAFVKAMGLDPRTAVGEVVMFGDGFEKTSATIVANLGPSRGNIEGWLLAAPGYKSEDLDPETIVHSFIVEEEDLPRMWCAIPQTKSNKNYVLVGSFNRDTTIELVKELQTVGTDKLGEHLTGNTFLSMTVNDLSKAPIEIDEDQPGSGLIKTLQSITLSATGETDNLHVDCEVTTDSPARAQQLNQFIVGMKAMFQLAIPDNDAEAKHMAEMLNKVQVTYAEGSPSVTANFAVGYDVIQQAIDAKHGHKHD